MQHYLRGSVHCAYCRVSHGTPEGSFDVGQTEQSVGWRQQAEALATEQAGAANAAGLADLRFFQPFVAGSRAVIEVAT